MDGTAKGGIAYQVSQALSCPVKYIGVGEKAEDLQRFSPEDFSMALFGGENKDQVV
jgi:fused signal recognition particle receptor